MSALSENIKKFRIKNNITQEELAEKLSVTRQAVSNWENGKTEPDIEMLTKLAQIFDISIDELVSGTPQEVTLLRGKKTHLYIGTAFTTFYLLSTLFMIVAEPSVTEYQGSTYDVLPSAFLLLILRPITVFCLGIGVSSILCYAFGCYARDKRLRVVLTIAGAVISVIGIGWLMYIFFGVYVFSIQGLPVFIPAQFYISLCEYPIVHAIGAALLFFGLAKK